MAAPSKVYKVERCHCQAF